MTGDRHHLWGSLVIADRHHLWGSLVNADRHHLWGSLVNADRHHLWGSLVNTDRHHIWDSLVTAHRHRLHWLRPTFGFPTRGTANAEMKASAETPKLSMVFSFMSAVSQNIALHDPLTAKSSA